MDLNSGLSVRRSVPAPAEWLIEGRAVASRLGLPEVEIRQSDKVGSPHVAGLFRSVVMLPPQAATWTPEARQATLVHELTHIRRHDRRTQALAQLACAAYWFNPLVWYAAPRWTPAAALSMARPSAMEGRLLLILAHATSSPRRSSRWLVTAVLAPTATAILGARTTVPPTPVNPADQQPARARAMPSVTNVDDQRLDPSLVDVSCRH